jgi:flagellar hook-length control protein FliK
MNADVKAPASTSAASRNTNDSGDFAAQLDTARNNDRRQATSPTDGKNIPTQQSAPVNSTNTSNTANNSNNNNSNTRQNTQRTQTSQEASALRAGRNVFATAVDESAEQTAKPAGQTTATAEENVSLEAATNATANNMQLAQATAVPSTSPSNTRVVPTIETVPVVRGKAANTATGKQTIAIDGVQGLLANTSTGDAATIRPQMPLSTTQTDMANILTQVGGNNIETSEQYLARLAENQPSTSRAAINLAPADGSQPAAQSAQTLNAAGAQAVRFQLDEPIVLNNVLTNATQAATTTNAETTQAGMAKSTKYQQDVTPASALRGMSIAPAKAEVASAEPVSATAVQSEPAQADIDAVTASNAASKLSTNGLENVEFLEALRNAASGLKGLFVDPTPPNAGTSGMKVDNIFHKPLQTTVKVGKPTASITQAVDMSNVEVSAAVIGMDPELAKIRATDNIGTANTARVAAPSASNLPAGTAMNVATLQTPAANIPLGNENIANNTANNAATDTTLSNVANNKNEAQPATQSATTPVADRADNNLRAAASPMPYVNIRQVNPAIMEERTLNFMKKNIAADTLVSQTGSAVNSTANGVNVASSANAQFTPATAVAGSSQNEALPTEAEQTTLAKPVTAQGNNTNLQMPEHTELGEITNKDGEPQQAQQAKEDTRTMRWESIKDAANLSKLIQQAAQNGVNKLTVRLTPENLGRLEVQLTEIGGRIDAKIVANSQESRALLAASGDAIRQQLADKGIQINNMDFSFHDSLERQDQNNHGQAGRQTNERQGNGKFSLSMADEPEVDEALLGKDAPKDNAMYA